MLEIRVVVAWVRPLAQDLEPLTLPAGATVEMAIAASALPARYGIDVGALRLGVNGRLTRRDAVLSEGDRVEIYRPLLIDPKTARHRRALAKAPSITDKRHKKS